MAALLQVGAWTHAEKIMNRLPIHYTVAQSHIAEALQKLIHRTIQPMHKRYEFIVWSILDNYSRKKRNWADECFHVIDFDFRYSGLNCRIRSKTYEPLNNNGAPIPVKTFDEFRSTVVPMLLALGPFSADDPVLLYKTLRILKSSLGIVCIEELTVINYFFKFQ